MGGAPAYARQHIALLDEAATLRPNYLAMRELGPRPTLGELQRTTPWLWLWCERCQHHAPLACAVAVIRWGQNASSDKLRACARCTSCGGKGATIQRPGWAGNHIGFEPFPTSEAWRMIANRPRRREAARLRHTLTLPARDQLASRQLVAGSSRSSAPSCNRAGSRSPSIARPNTERASSSGFTVLLPTDLSVSHASSKAFSISTRL